MESPLITEQLKALLNSINTSQSIDIDYCLNKYNTIMHLAGSMSLKLCKKKKTKRVSSNKKWHDTDLKKMRYSLDNKGKMYAKFPNDPVIRGSLYKLQREYSKLCKKSLENLNWI